jgi:hypothetical protein
MNATDSEQNAIAELASGCDSLLRVLGDLQRFCVTLKRLSWSDAHSGAIAHLTFSVSPTIDTDHLVHRLMRHPGVRNVALEPSKAGASSRGATSTRRFR